MDVITSSSSAWSGSYVTMTKEQVLRVARQLPPHDYNARHCHRPLSDDEKRRLEEFRDSRCRDALGLGTLLQLEKKSVCRQVGNRAGVKCGVWVARCKMLKCGFCGAGCVRDKVTVRES